MLMHTHSKAEWEIEQTKPVESWPEKGEIHFKDFSVKYRQELDIVLNKISFNIKSAEKVDIFLPIYKIKYHRIFVL